MLWQRVSRPIADALVQSHVWIGGGALCMGLHTIQMLGFPIENDPFWLLLFAGTVFSYTLIGWARGRQVSGDTPHLRWARLSVMVISGMASLLALWHIPSHTYTWLLVGALGTLLFILPLRNGRRLRDIPFFKVFYISLLWTYATLILPAMVVGVSIPFLWLAGRYFFILGITLPFDIRDMEQDQREGLRTFPLLLGWLNVRNLAIGSLVMSVFMILLQGLTETSGVHAATVAMVVTLVLAGVIVSQVRPELPRRYFDIGLDGTLFLPGLLYVIWQALT